MAADHVSENPPSGKQMVSKMLVIKKVSKEDPSTAFSAGFATAGALPTNGNKAPIAGSSVYKNLVPKPAVAPTKVGLAVKLMAHICIAESLFVLSSRAPSGNPVEERSQSLASTCQAEIQS